jgi:hypothetical protein
VAPSSSLDLSSPSGPPAPTGPTTVGAPRPASPGRRPAAGHIRPVVRARSGTQTILSPKSPTVVLTRLQTGIGVLTFEAATSDSVGDLRLGCAYQLRSGHSSTVQHAGGNPSAPKDSRLPMIVGRRERFERIGVDLRQSPEIERLIVYGFSESGQQLNWGGTLVLTTIGGARVELPLDRPASGGVMVFMSVFNVHSEFVIRAEMETVNGSIRDACKAYGYDRITWVDEKTPLE